MAKLSTELEGAIRERVLKEIEIAAPEHTGASFAEYGISGLKRSGGYVREEFLPQLVWPRAAKIYQEMSSNDPVIGAILYVCEQFIKSIKWRVETEGSSPADLEAQEFINSCMHDMSTTWIDFIDEVLTMITFGFSWHEEVYKTREGYSRDPHKNSKYSDGRIGWRKLAGRSQATIDQWVFAEDGGIIAAIQRADPDYSMRTIPMEKSLLFRTKYRYNNPEGRSLLRNSYRSWYFKKHIEEIEGIGIERDLAGLPVLQTPEGVDIWNPADAQATVIRNKAEALVQNIRRDENEGVVIPHGWLLSLLSTGGRRQIDTNAIINRYDQRMAITLLADIVMMGTQGMGSFALANVKRGLLRISLDAITNNIAEVLNRYAVPRLIRLNAFPGLTSYPRIVPGEIVTPGLNEVARFIQALAGAKAPLFPDTNLEEYLRDLVGMPSLQNVTEEEREQQLQFVLEMPRRGGGPNMAVQPDDQRQQNVGLPSDAR